MNKIIRNGKVFSNEYAGIPRVVIQDTSYDTALSPNVFYQFGELSTFNLSVEPGNNPNMVNEYMFAFTSGSTATVFTYDTSHLVMLDPDFRIEANAYYEGSIVNGVIVIMGVDMS